MVEHLDLLIGSICMTWILFSTFMVLIICMNLGRLRRDEDKNERIRISKKNASMGRGKKES